MDDITLCPHCLGEGWTCESHPGKPFGHDGCDGAGDLCVCNPRVRPPKGMQVKAVSDEYRRMQGDLR